MDLPPPLFRHEHHRHLRYGNVLHPPDFIRPSYGPHVPPPLPPQPRPPHILLPPPTSPPPPPPAPPPPVRYIGHPAISPRFTFSPPHQPLLERPHFRGFDPTRKPYFHHEILPPPPSPPPPPPPPPRESIPMRFIHDYPERNPILRDEDFDRGCTGNYIRDLPGNCGRNLHWGAMELHSRIPDIGDHERHRDSFCQSRESCNNRDADGRRWDSGINDWVHDLYNKRDYDGGRWDGDIGDRVHALFSERDYDERRWNGGIRDYDERRWNGGIRDYDERRWNGGIGDYDEMRWNGGIRDYDERRWNGGITDYERDYDERRWSTGISDLGCSLCNERVYDESRWNSVISDWGHALCNERDYDEKRWDSGIGDHGHMICNGKDYDERGWNNGISDGGYGSFFDRDGDERRWNYGSTDGALSKPESMEPECSDHGLTLGKFCGRLEKGVSKGEFIRSKKRRLQKKNALHRIQSGKACIGHSGGRKRLNLSKKLSNCSFRGKEIEGSGQLQTRVEDNREREQSPVELAISFKSNAFIAKAILAPSYPDVKSDFNSMDANRRTMYSMSGSSVTQSNKDVIEADHLTSGLDLLSDSQGISKVHLDKAVASGSRSASAHDATDLNKNFVKNEALKDNKLQGRNSVGSGRTRVRQLRKKRRAGKKLSHETNLQMTKVCGDTINSNNCINRSAVCLLNLDSALLKGNTSSSSTSTVPDTALLPSLVGVTSNKVDVDGDSYKPFVSNLKRRRSSLPTSSVSSCLADNLITQGAGHVESFLHTIKDADHVCKLRTNEFACHARENMVAKLNTSHADVLGFNLQSNNVNKNVNNRASVLDTEKKANKSISRCARFCTNRVDDICEHPFQNGLVLLENDCVTGPSEVKISMEGHDMVGLSRTQETRILELQDDKYKSAPCELDSSSEPCSYLVQKPQHVNMPKVGSPDASLLEISTTQVNIPQVGGDAEKFRNLEGAAVTDSANVSLGIAMSSSFHSMGYKRNVAFLDAMRKKSFSDVVDQSHSLDCVERSPKLISHAKPCLSLDCSSRLITKRKARNAQTASSDSKSKVVIYTDRSIGGEVAAHSAKDFVPAAEVGSIGDKNSCKDDDNLNKGPSGVEDPTQEDDFGASGSFHGSRKKRKVVSPGLDLSLSEDDTVADGPASDCSKLGQGSARFADWRSEQREDSLSAFTAANKRGTTGVEGKVGIENINATHGEQALATGDKLHVNDELVFGANNQSLCAAGNDNGASCSSDELLASDFDLRSCLSSPEVMSSFSDLSFSRSVKVSACQSENEMTYWRNDISNRKPVPAEPCNISLGKSVEKAASGNLQSTSEILPSLPKDSSKVGKKLNLVHGKLNSRQNQLTSAVPKVFPGHHPISFGPSRKFNSNHVTKSRTWHRTGNSCDAVTEPKTQPSSLPQSHGTKTAAATQSSYVRKGNSLVRKASPSGFHGSSSSVYRLTPCRDNLKNNQSSNSKTGDSDAPTQLRIERVNVSETPKALPLKDSLKSSNCTACNSGESLPVGSAPIHGCPSEPLDALEGTVITSDVPEWPTGTVNDSDSQITVEEENSRKKIMYVKRKSNQLVAASSTEDTSMLGVDKEQASSSDGYYMSRKNQLVRASSENCKKNREANVDSRKPVSHAILPRTSSRRLSGFVKTYRSSKFSFVWKLHDTRSSEKHKNVLGSWKVLPHLFPRKRATHWKSFMHAVGTKLNNSSFSTASQKLLLSRKRGAIYTRSTHGYSLRMSKVLSVGGSSLKWSKSIERNSKKANEEATRAVAAAEQQKKEENGSIPVGSKSRNHVSRKLVLSVKLRPGERIFRIGPERYRMDPTRRTLHRITGEKEPSSSAVVQSEKKAKRSYVPRRLLIGNDEYVRIGNGNQLVRDPKKRTRVLASEKVRWSLRTARLRLARKKKYCQFFTRFGKCNKDDGKCPYIHDPSKIVVCTKFLNGSCSNPDCKLTHKVIPERMQDCSYFLKGSCSNENCPYRHVNVNPDSTVCESFLRGYCADGNECPKKHTYICPAFEATGTCPQASTCKLHHPKKMERKPPNELKIVRGRYFDGGLVALAECSMATTDKFSAKGKDDMVSHGGKFPDYISLEVSDDETDHSSAPNQVCNGILPDAQIAESGELIKPSFTMNRDSLVDSSPATDSREEMSSSVPEETHS